MNELKLLIDQGFDVNWQNKYKYNALHAAILMNNKSDVIEFLIKNDANVNAQGGDGKTPLHYVVNVDTTECLIKSSANVNVQDHKGNTPLHMQTDHKPHVIDLFLRAGADVNLRNKDNKSALDSGRCIQICYNEWQKEMAKKKSVTNVQDYSQPQFFDRRKVPTNVAKQRDGGQASKYVQRLGQSRGGNRMW